MTDEWVMQYEMAPFAALSRGHMELWRPRGGPSTLRAMLKSAGVQMEGRLPNMEPYRMVSEPFSDIFPAPVPPLLFGPHTGLTFQRGSSITKPSPDDPADFVREGKFPGYGTTHEARTAIVILDGREVVASMHTSGGKNHDRVVVVSPAYRKGGPKALPGWGLGPSMIALDWSIVLPVRRRSEERRKYNHAGAKNSARAYLAYIEWAAKAGMDLHPEARRELDTHACTDEFVARSAMVERTGEPVICTEKGFP
jgi:hypothetical protein